ncbi:hypothetical protein SH528x_002167 [Novipirellula sp. SH528]|uniref:hypothetical protein n=1 Tax=Novipirellula sp. SH528 TaxID=3454466 RepID=UPI003FA0012C
MKSPQDAKQIANNYAPVSSTKSTAAHYRRRGPQKLVAINAQSQLDRQIARLLSLHKDLRICVKDQDIAGISDEAKRALLDDLNDLLGIKT